MIIKKINCSDSVTGFVKIEISKSKKHKFLCWEFSLEEVAGEIILSDFNSDRFPLETTAADMRRLAEELANGKCALMVEAFASWQGGAA
jgi:hypothetical protein